MALDTGCLWWRVCVCCTSDRPIELPGKQLARASLHTPPRHNVIPSPPWAACRVAPSARACCVGCPRRHGICVGATDHVLIANTALDVCSASALAGKSISNVTLSSQHTLSSLSHTHTNSHTRLSRCRSLLCIGEELKGVAAAGLRRRSIPTLCTVSRCVRRVHHSHLPNTDRSSLPCCLL
jgi:hypothetical protein